MIRHEFLDDEGIVAALPVIADHLTKTEVRRPAYDDLDSAIAWIKQGCTKAAL